MKGEKTRRDERKDSAHMTAVSAMETDERSVILCVRVQNVTRTLTQQTHLD